MLHHVDDGNAVVSSRGCICSEDSLILIYYRIHDDTYRCESFVIRSRNDVDVSCESFMSSSSTWSTMLLVTTVVVQEFV